MSIFDVLKQKTIELDNELKQTESKLIKSDEGIRDFLVKYFIKDEKKNKNKTEQVIRDEVEDDISKILASNPTPKGQTNNRSIIRFIEFFETKAVESDVMCAPPLQKTDIEFDNIAGLEREKDSMRTAFIFPLIFSGLFRSGPAKGILLYGPPGTGKTLLARASVNEVSDALFFAPSPGDLRGKYEGETEQKIEAVFKCASKALTENKNKRFAIILFDELDGFVPSRTEDNPGATRTVNTFLQMMDGINSIPGISVLGVTNIISNVDDAVLRRFSEKIFIDLPGLEARKYIIEDIIAKNYCWPIEGKEDKRDKKDKLEEALKNIKKYCLPDVKTSGLLFGSVSTNIIDQKYINELAVIMGPQPSAKDDIVKMDKRINDDEFSKYAKYKYGYSASDITKVLELAIRLSALRSLEDRTTKETITTIKVNGTEYYVYVPKGNEVKERSNVWTISSLMGVSEQAGKYIVSFDIRPSDIDNAMREYKPTVTNYNKYTISREE